MADALASFALDQRKSFSLKCDEVPRSQQDESKLCGSRCSRNYVAMSDGACRQSSKTASAGWAIFEFCGNSVRLIAAGALQLASGSTSIEAECSGLECSIKALKRLSQGTLDVTPHEVEATLDIQEFDDQRSRERNRSI